MSVTQFVLGTITAFCLGYACGLRTAAVDITTYETDVEHRDEEDEWEAA